MDINKSEEIQTSKRKNNPVDDRHNEKFPILNNFKATGTQLSQRQTCRYQTSNIVEIFYF